MQINNPYQQPAMNYNPGYAAYQYNPMANMQRYQQSDTQIQQQIPQFQQQQQVIGINGKIVAAVENITASGIVKLRGLTNQCRARFLVSYSGNIQIPTGGTVEAISLAIAIDGEPLQSTRMIVTPAAVENFFNVSAQAYVDVPRGCCVTAAVQNTSAQAIEVQNSNLIAVREA